MTDVLWLAFVLLTSSAYKFGVSSKLQPESDNTAPVEVKAMSVVLSALPKPDCPVVTITDIKDINTMLIKKNAALGNSVIEVLRYGHNANWTGSALSKTNKLFRQLQYPLTCMTVLMVSDDPSFLFAFAESALKSRLLLWKTRLVILTRIPHNRLQSLHKLLSTSNSLIFVLHDNHPTLRISLYLSLPYTNPDDQLQVASWSEEKGLTLTSHIPLFPDKFVKFIVAPTLLVGIEVLTHHKIYWEDDPASPGGRRLVFTGAVSKTIDYFGRGMNFTYVYVRSKEWTFGTLEPDGSWTGMMGLIVREETDFAVGPFILSKTRGDAVDYTSVLWTENMRIVSRRGLPEVDPWGFLLPLDATVWISIVTSLVGMLVVVDTLSWMSTIDIRQRKWVTEVFVLIRIIFQQSIQESGAWWWWKRVMVGVWMLMTLVLTRSYAGNLMSLLAVRHIPQPYQTLNDVLDDPKITMIWQKNSDNEQYLRAVKSGIYREVMEQEQNGRLLFHTLAQFSQSLHDFVRHGGNVLIDADVTVRNVIAELFSMTGQCEYYVSNAGFLPFHAVVISQKTNPILRGLNKRVLSLASSGIFRYWFKTQIPNSTTCAKTPSTITKTVSLGLTNLWGMFVVLAGGLIGGCFVFCLELLTARLDGQVDLN